MTPQAFISSYAPRLRICGNSLLTPVIPQTTAQTAPLSRTTKRGTTAINYAENEYDDDDIFEDSEGPRRHTGLRSRREDPNQVKKEGPADKVGREIHAPVEVQGIWRDWMGKLRSVKYVSSPSTQVTSHLNRNFLQNRQTIACTYSAPSNPDTYTN